VRTGATVALACIALLTGCATGTGRTPAPPVAVQRPHVVESPHGERTDEYYWLRDDHPERKRDDVMAYLRA